MAAGLNAPTQAAASGLSQLQAQADQNLQRNIETQMVSSNITAGANMVEAMGQALQSTANSI